MYLSPWNLHFLAILHIIFWASHEFMKIKVVKMHFSKFVKICGREYYQVCSIINDEQIPGKNAR